MISINDIYNNYKYITDIANDAINEDGNIITTRGIISKYNKYGNRMYFKLSNNQCSISCYVENELFNDVINNVGKTITATGKISFTFNKTFSNYQLQLKITDIDIEMEEFEKPRFNYDIVKKDIKWSNIKNILVLSKDDTHGYNDFLSQTVEKFVIEDLVNIYLQEIVLEGPGVEKSLINAIKNCDKEKYDIIMIIRGGGNTESISNSFDKVSIFDAIKNSPVPVITAIGHSDDKDNKLFITQVSDKDYPTPTAAGLDIYELYVAKASEHINNKRMIIEYYVSEIIEEYSDDILKYYSMLNNLRKLCKYKNITNVNKDCDVIVVDNVSYKFDTTKLDVIDCNETIALNIIDGLLADEHINNIDYIINNCKNVELVEGCKKVKEFAMMKNMNEIFNIIDEIKSDNVIEFMQENNVLNKDIIEAIDDINEGY